MSYTFRGVRFTWWRPPTFTSRRTDAEIKAAAQRYVAWLARARGWTQDRAHAYIAELSQRRVENAPAWRQVDIETAVREAAARDNSR